MTPLHLRPLFFRTVFLIVTLFTLAGCGSKEEREANYQQKDTSGREKEWEMTRSGDRTEKLTGWIMVLQRFRWNVTGASKEEAMKELKESETWAGQITGDLNLDRRIIKMAVQSRLNHDGAAWGDLDAAFRGGADHSEIASVVTKHGF